MNDKRLYLLVGKALDEWVVSVGLGMVALTM